MSGQAKPQRKPISRRQLKIGRLMTGLSINRLSRLSYVSMAIIKKIETGRAKRSYRTHLWALENALRKHGIEFHADGWVRHIDDMSDTHVNPDGIRDDRGARLKHALALANVLLQVLTGEIALDDDNDVDSNGGDGDDDDRDGGDDGNGNDRGGGGDASGDGSGL